MIRTKLTTLFLALVLSCGLAFGQTATGSLSGTITDANGAAVPGAKLTATSKDTGSKLETVSSEAGLYVFPAVPAAGYSLSVEKAGFKKLTRTNIEVRIAQRLDLDLKLEVGDVQQSIEVTAESPLLETSTSDKSASFSPKFMSEVPLFTGAIRNPRAFLSYMPGVNGGNGEGNIVSGSGGRAGEVQIDGASAIIPESGGTVFNPPSAEMFQEFKLITGGYSAEYGRFGGGVEIYSTKSGSSWYHGTAFLNMRRDIWNANAWARNANPNPAQNFRPKERQNEVGGAGGGPVYIPKVYDGRNKSFFYYTYTQRLLPANVSFPLNTVPTAAFKAGDFSALGSQLIYDPATTQGTTRQPFPGNRIPTNRFSTVSRNLLPLIPDPTRAASINNFDFVNTDVIEQKIWSIKADHAFTTTNRLSFFLSKEDGGTASTSVFPGPIGQGLGFSGQLPWNIRVNHDYSFTPALFMHTTFGYSATRQLWDNPAQAGAGSKLGIPGLAGAADATPRVQFAGQAGLTPYGVQDGKVANGGQDNDTLMITQGYTWLKGKHEIKFGGDWRKLTTFGFDLAGSNGLYQFSRAQTAIPNSTTGSGHEFASLLLGVANQASSTVLPVLLDQIQYNYTSGFLQDNYRLTKKLTLNLGIRYEVPIGWHIQNGNYSGLDPNKPNPGAGNIPGALVFYGTGPGRTGQTRPYKTDWSNIGPRIGFAYQAAPKTVIRGGWGIFYQTLGNGGCGCRQGFANTNSLVSDGVNPVLNWDGGIPVGANFKPPPLLDPTLSNFQNIDWFPVETYGKAPRIYNWSFNIQHEVRGFLLDVAYVANQGNGLNSTLNVNQLPTSELSRGSQLTQPLSSAAAAGVRIPFAGYPLTRNVSQALRPYPQYNDVYSRNSSVGQTWYDSLQVKVERRFGNFQLLSSYTWSKSLMNAHFRQIFSQQFNVGTQDAYNVAEGKSYSPFDQPKVLNIVWTYDLPFGKGKKFLGASNSIVNGLVGGWVLSGAQRYTSGNVIQLVTPGNPLASVLGSTVTKANLASGGAIRTNVSAGDLDPNNPATRWFNSAPFSSAAPFTLGTAALYHDDFRQPAVFSENVGLSKRTVLWNNEKNPVVLSYRADAFNLLNRTRFGGVNGAIGNAAFGRPSGPQVGARAITMGLRLSF